MVGKWWCPGLLESVPYTLSSQVANLHNTQKIVIFISILNSYYAYCLDTLLISHEIDSEVKS